MRSAYLAISINDEPHLRHKHVEAYDGDVTFIRAEQPIAPGLPRDYGISKVKYIP